MRKIAESFHHNGIPAFEYYLSDDKKYVWSIGSFSGRKNNIFSDVDYWKNFMPNEVYCGPWQFLDHYTDQDMFA